MSNADDSPFGRAFRIMETLSAHPDGLTLSEIAAATDLVVATVHRQLNTLISVGAVRKLNTKAFVLGERMWMMASQMTNGADITHSAAPVLKDLADRFGETAFLARLVGQTVEVMSTCTPTAFGQSFVQPGRGMPLYAAATGKILLAQSSDSFIDDYLTLPRKAFTANTKVEEADIRAEIGDIRSRQVAVCNNEFDPGILSYAAAVEDRRTGITYALAVFGLADRFSTIDRGTVETQLLNAAHRLSLSLRGIG
ncbi:IclR family transcriptional regulator [Pseudodonghicola flavimaris]|uniref:IclR family transcriptional regulator n=1 Tax=Pseudodonghicola flavimaris TaxID=3050036 RepID=A0ABT7F5A6_9RHOB|nr:IclR family transcriptional regulator [Pseudodonghicola flavimaris]MDK3019781.1 IclR family transcriptional regulator [Pseudodonghicola flavimaris]